MEKIVEEMVEVLRRTWVAISNDVCREKGEYFSGKDAGMMAADFIEIHGGDRDAAKVFLNLEFKGKMKVIRKAFPEKWKCY